jgi:hypothetical protein
MNVQGAFNLLFRPGLRANFLDEWQQYEPEYSQFLVESTTDKPEQSATIIAGLSRLFERGDGEPITYDTAKMGPKVVGIDKEFAGGFMLTKKTVEDDQYGKARALAKGLAHAVQMTKEYRSAALLDDAFTGATFLGIDNLSLCNTAHTLINSSKTVSNKLATAVGISVAGITAAFDLFAQMKDENGDPIKMFPDKIIIGNNAGDIQRTIQIFGSDKEPFTAENQDNAIKKRLSKPTVVVSHYKASAKPWFMIDSKYNDTQFVTRRAPQFDDDFDFNTDAALYKATMRFLIWFVNWRGWVGSNAS